MQKFERFWEVRGRGFTDEEWDLICAEVSMVLEECPVDLVGPFGTGKPNVNGVEISFTGKDGADGFFFYKAASGMCSCDTEGKPYDEVVVSVLAIAKRIAGDILDVPGFLDQSSLRRIYAAWETLPKGWTSKSVEKLWNSLSGGPGTKHPVSACIKKMEGKIDDPGAYCAGLSDKVRGKGWRSER